MDELKNRRIFIVDDNVTNLAVFGASLRRSGARVFQDAWTVGTVRQVLQFLPIDVILLDLMLRNQTSGYDMFDELTKYPELAGVPIIAVSAADPGTEIPKAKAKGFAGYIGKPIRPRLFPEQIAACINGKHIWYVPDGNWEETTR